MMFESFGVFSFSDENSGSSNRKRDHEGVSNTLAAIVDADGNETLHRDAVIQEAECIPVGMMTKEEAAVENGSDDASAKPSDSTPSGWGIDIGIIPNLLSVFGDTLTKGTVGKPFILTESNSEDGGAEKKTNEQDENAIWSQGITFQKEATEQVDDLRTKKAADEQDKAVTPRKMKERILSEQSPRGVCDFENDPAFLNIRNISVPLSLHSNSEAVTDLDAARLILADMKEAEKKTAQKVNHLLPYSIEVFWGLIIGTGASYLVKQQFFVF
mmetsp:Transcript_39240/g.87741  ORF Transcript_39240/g.87741 Transcript_39240/m.87741 type:complete len:271 (+) Transcript_39240:66-878(+)